MSTLLLESVWEQQTSTSSNPVTHAVSIAITRESPSIQAKQSTTMVTMKWRRSETIQYFLLLSSVLLWLPTCQSQESFSCSICPNGGIMGNPDGVVTSMNGQSTGCAQLQEYAVHLPQRSCQNLQSLAVVPCECPGFNSTETAETVRTEEEEPFQCSICGDGVMTQQDGMTLNSVGRPTKCQTLQDESASITESACGTVQSFARIPCGCTSGAIQGSSITGSGVAGNFETLEESTMASLAEGVSDTSSISVCSVCGEGGRMDNPNGVVENNRGQRRSCSVLAASVENIPADTCANMQELAREPCGCTTPDSDMGNQEIPGELPFLCSVCGDGSVMTRPQGTVSPRPGQTVRCGALEANAGNIPQSSCATLQVLSQEPCGCTVQEQSQPTDLDNIAIGEDEFAYQCPICDGGEMTVPQGVVTSRQGNSARCDVLLANSHTIPETACPNVQALAKDPCGCMMPSNANSSATTESMPNTDRCNVCDGGNMTNPTGIVTTPQGQSARCSALDANSISIPTSRCPSIQALAVEPCGCTLGKPINEIGPDGETLQVDGDSAVCNVCGEDRNVGRAGKMITTSMGMFTCSGAQRAGLMGMIPADHCESMSISIQQECGCFAEGPTAAPSPRPYFCSVCGDGLVVTRPSVAMNVTGTANNVTCGQYDAAARNGDVREDQCPILQEAAAQACGCKEPPPAPTEAPTVYQCPICGEGRTIGFPNAEVVLPNTQRMTCAGLLTRSETGIIQETQCLQIQPFVEEACGCVDVAVLAPTEAPTAFECNVCGDGLKVTHPEGVVVIPTQPDRTCAQLEEAASIGNINPNQCRLLHPFVLTPCGCTDQLTDSPSYEPTAPTVSPAPSSITMRDDCFSDLGEIYAMERNVEDTSVKRKYVLCPGRTFQMGMWTDEDEIKDGEPFLALRPNVVYQCGEDGSRMNNCILKGGDFGVASYYGVFEGIYETVPGVEIIGLSFESQNLFSVLLQAAGDITFIGCAFKGNNNNAPVLIQWNGDSPEPTPAQINRALEASPIKRDLQDQTLQHVVSFQDCVFRDNHVDSSMSFPGVIENSFNSNLVLSNCLFQSNVYGDETNPSTLGYAVRSFGPLSLDSNCFIDNQFLGHAPILVYGNQFSATNNYIETTQNDLTCEFVALFNSQDDRTEALPTCQLSDALACAFNQAPTVAPTEGEATSSPTQTLEEWAEDPEIPAASPTVSEKPTGASAASSRISTISLIFSTVIAIVLGCLPVIRL